MAQNYETGLGQATKESEIVSAEHFLDKNLSELNDCLTILLKRIDPVLRPDTPKLEKNATGVEQKANSPLVDFLRSHSSVTCSMIDRVKGILDRLEL
jgi:hypothetical protein